jgi:RNA polymerase sigma-70 factor (ECF subfamily)
MYDPEQEETLLAAAQAGDRDAFGSLYDALLPGLYGYVRARMTSDLEAEDVVSDAILSVVKKLRDFRWRYPGSFRGWVFQIARRELIDFYRQNRLITAPMQNAHESFPDPLPDPETWALRGESRADLLAMISRLSERKQEVVILRYFGGLRNTEIAAVLDLDERTVAAHISRALDELQSGLAREDLNNKEKNHV